MKTTRLTSSSILVASIFGLCLNALPQTPQSSAGTAGIEGLQPTVHNVPAMNLHTVFSVNSGAILGCPVSLRAQHGMDGSMVQVNKNHPRGVAQLLHLTISDRSSSQIVSASLRVHGLSGVPRVTQTLSGSDQGDSVQSFTVPFHSSSGKTATADLWVPAVTAVLKIDLTSVTYADGSQRTFLDRDDCRITPDPLMLVSAR